MPEYALVDLTTEPPYEPKLPKGVSWCASIPSGKDGKPLSSKCVVIIWARGELTNAARLTAKQHKELWR